MRCTVGDKPALLVHSKAGGRAQGWGTEWQRWGRGGKRESFLYYLPLEL